MATHSSILAWEIPWTEEPGGLHGWATQGPGRFPAGPGPSLRAVTLQARALGPRRTAESFGPRECRAAPG